MAQLGSVPSWGDGGRGFRSRCSEREWGNSNLIEQRISVNFRSRWEESEQLDSKQEREIHGVISSLSNLDYLIIYISRTKPFF